MTTPAHASLDPTEVAAADRADPLTALVGAFERPDPGVAYLDGNSLGRPPRATRERLAATVDRWATDLVQGWDDWIDRGLEVGDHLAPVLGAAPGQVIVAESTTVSLYGAVSAVLDARASRSTIVTCAHDFPTDRYVVGGLARSRGMRVHPVALDALADAVDDDTAAVVASSAHFETAELADIAAVTAAAHRVGALVVWDGSHAAGAVPLDLDRVGVDVAVGCTYKYLHGGPGAPAWTYVSSGQPRLRPPIQGWFAQRDQFAMGDAFDPVDGVAGWRAGTPGILGLEAADVGITTVASVPIEAIRTKSLALGRLMLAAADEWFEPLGFTLASPREDRRRGGHVALRHPDASRIVRAGRDVGVIADFRAPDLVRLGPGPLATTRVEVLDGLRRLRDVVAAGDHERLPPEPGRVT